MRAVFLVVWLWLEWEGGGAAQCDRSLGQMVPKTKADGRFSLTIVGDPNTYQPSETYTVKLAGMRTGQLSARFIGFSLVMEGSPGVGSGLRPAPNTGSFVLFGDAFTKFTEECPSMVSHTTLVPKSEVQVMWTAPPSGHGCITFKATVLEAPDRWYQDDAPLSKTICEDSLGNDEETPINQHCCACDEAKYEMTFEGLWSRHTHPKDFPTNITATRFSDVIGASHTTDYRFWEYSGIASEGLKQVAEKGSTRMLESELKSQSQHIRTIIKARGISYPNVTGKTFAVFRVDNKHHLISVVSMMDPSPDWIVGVSAFELCLPNCTWLENKMINLYPWDAGTDSGITYTSPDMPTEPRDHIRRITSSFPSDVRSPFYDPTGEEMKPLARLYLTRQRLYEKSCSESNIEYHNNEVCEVGPWSAWSSCSVTCGIGKRMKQRSFKNPARAELKGCNQELTKRSPCHMPPCNGINGGSQYEEKEDKDGQCATTEWSPWSGCSVLCGKGEMHRFRNLINWKSCMATGKIVMLQQDSMCIGEKGETCPPPEEEVAEALREQCEVGMWSHWSPCSVSCGNGTMSRVRKLVDPGYGMSTLELEKRCSGIQLKEVLSCQGLPNCKLSPHEAKEVCQLPKEVGPCRGHFEKWFFDSITQNCEKFAYSGCRGNRNSFQTQEECEETCRELKDDTTEHLFGGIQPESLYGHTIYPVTGADGPVIDCKVSSWTGWSECSVTCGRGLRERTRHILTHAKNGGKVCPKKLLRRRRCNLGPCPGSRRDEDGKDDYEDDDSSVARDDCVYSDWGPWSRCSMTCGNNGIQQRTRSVDMLATPNPAYCTDRLQTRICHLRPCRIYQYY